MLLHLLHFQKKQRRIIPLLLRANHIRTKLHVIQDFLG